MSAAISARSAALLRIVAAVVLAARGVIHLMGVALLWRLGEPGTLSYADVRPAPGSAPAALVGAVWLLAGALFVFAAVLVIRHRPRWAVVVGVAALMSVAVLAPSATVATAGLVIDVAVIGAVVVAGLRARRARVRVG